MHRIVSEKLCMKNSKLNKECMGSLTFLTPSNFAGPTVSLLYIGNAFYWLTRMLISKHACNNDAKKGSPITPTLNAVARANETRFVSSVCMFQQLEVSRL